MDAILRIINHMGARDFDLSTEWSSIRALQLLFAPAGDGDGWSYQCPDPIIVNGRASAAGQVQIGDAYLVDQATRTKALVLPKISGRRKKLSFSAELSAGRGTGNRLRLDDPTVSGKHCVFYWDGGALYLRDLGSTNGTYVNDQVALSGTPWRLEQGDIIKLGRYTLEVNGGLCLRNADNGVLFQAEPGGERAWGVPRNETGKSGAGRTSIDGADSAGDTEPPGKKSGEAQSGADRNSACQDRLTGKTKKPYPWFSRAPRMMPVLPALSVQIEDAPGIGEKPGMGMSAIAMSIPAMAISIGMTALRYGLGKRKYTKAEEERADLYARYLTGIENQLQTHAKSQRELLKRLHPETRECLARVDGPAMSLWERHPGDEDFLSLRLGLGSVPAAAKISYTPRHLQMKEDEYTRLPEQMAAKYASVEDVPLCCELFRDGVCGVIGPRTQAVELVQSFVAQLAALHSYEEVKIVIVFPKSEYRQWSWMRWLPHCASAERDIRYIACTPEDVKEILPPLETAVKARIASEKEWSFGMNSPTLPHYVFIVADSSLLSGSPVIGTAMMMNRPELGLNGIILGQSLSDFPHSVRNVLRVAPGGAGLHIVMTRGGETLELDSGESRIDTAVYRVFARRMAPIRLAGTGQRQQGLPSVVTLFEGLGIRQIEDLPLNDTWQNARPEETMSVPIGVKSGGDLFCFDIHESAQGPHGLVAGGTGSGKSKMVQAWVASMAIGFSPEDVNFILVDFKGESLVSPFRQLPHLAGFTSNIDPDVRRKFLAIESEMSRRMVLLKTGGDKPYDDIIAYRRARRQNPAMPPMPFLFLVVDEFAAFKDQYPEFIGPIDHLYQAGRSLGMMAILMTQKPSGKITPQMDANMGFSWCLQVKEEADSREVIGNADAAHLRGSGRAYVKAKDGTYELIQSLYGMAPYEPGRDGTRSSAQVFVLKLNGRAMEGTGVSVSGEGPQGPDELTVLSRHMAEYCSRKGIPAARAIWRDPLPNRLDLDALLERMGRPALMEETAASGEASGPEGNQKAAAGPRALLGLFDDPAHQIQDALEYDFWSQGNLAVYGASLSGKTTFLQTLLVSLCGQYHPDQVQFYLLEQGSYQLRTLERFPHVGGAAGDDEPDAMDKVVRFLLEELERRKRMFRKAGVGSPEGYAQRTGKAPAAILVLADHVNLLGESFYELTNLLTKLSVEGPAYAMFTVCTFSGTLGVNSKLKQSFKRAAALRLPDRVAYSDLVGKVVENPEELAVGRGYIRWAGETVVFQTAIVHAGDTDGQRAAYLQRMAEHLSLGWKGSVPTPVRTLPEEIPYGMLQGAPYVLGMDYESCETVSLTEPRRSLMIAAGVPGALRSVFRSLIRQAFDNRGEVWLCAKEAEGYADLLDEDHRMTEISQMDALIPMLRTPLQQRKVRHDEDARAMFPPMLVLVDDMKALLTQAQTETTGRLEAFVRIGEGLGFTLVCGGDAASMNYCRFSGSCPLPVTMRGMDRMIVGGTLAEHQLFDNAALRMKHPEPLAGDEGFLLEREGEVPVRLKLMRGDSDG